MVANGLTCACHGIAFRPIRFFFYEALNNSEKRESLSLSLISLAVSVDVKHHQNKQRESLPRITAETGVRTVLGLPIPPPILSLQDMTYKINWALKTN